METSRQTSHPRHLLPLDNEAQSSDSHIDLPFGLTADGVNISARLSPDSQTQIDDIGGNFLLCKPSLSYKSRENFTFSPGYGWHTYYSRDERQWPEVCRII